MSSSQRRTLYIPPINLYAYMCVLIVVARQRLGENFTATTYEHFFLLVILFNLQSVLDIQQIV
jgi:hypothetical protein